MRLGAIFYTLGFGGFMVAGLMSIPLLVSLVMLDAHQIRNFLMGFVLTAFISGAMFLSGQTSRRVPAREMELLLIMLLFFSLLPLLAAVPLYGAVQVTGFIAAYFESVSAMTTSGGTVIAYPQLEAAPILIWRSILAWLGGLWTLIFSAAVLAPFSVGGLQIIGSPLLQHDKDDSLTRRLGRPLRRILPLYLGLSIISVIALAVTGTPFFDAFCLALSAISTTGFTTHSGSLVGQINTLGVSLLMLICLFGAMGAPSLIMVGQGKYRTVWQNSEVKVFLSGLVVFSIISYVVLVGGFSDNFSGRALWAVVLQSISLATTAGFETLSGSELARWPTVWVFLPALLGGMALSTAGGIKIMRVIIVSKDIAREFGKLAYPSSVHATVLEGHRLEAKKFSAVWSFIAVFLLFVSVGLLLVTLFGLPLSSAWPIVLGAITNSLSAVNGLDIAMGFGAMDSHLQIIVALLMIAGRVEFLVLMIIFAPSFWRYLR